MHKLSDLLIAERVLTRTQVDEAMEAQALYGGNLDTCILELGLCDEPTLERLIAEAADAPNTVDPRYDRPSIDALTLFTEAEAARWRMIPFSIADRTVDVVCAAPPDGRTLDEAAFKIGMRLRPSVTTELRISVLLEQHYGIPRAARFSDLGRGAMLRPKDSSDDPFPEPACQSAGDGKAQSSVSMGDVIALDPAQRDLPQPARAVEDEPAKVSKYRPVGYSPERFDASLANFEDDRGDPTGVRRINAQLRNAQERDELPTLVFLLLLPYTRRAALFSVARGLCTGWDASGGTVDRHRIRTMAFPLSHPSIFQEAAQGDVFVGRMAPSKVNEEFARRMGEPHIQQVIVTPIKIRDKVVMMLVADCETERALEKAFSPVIETADKLARTLVRIILQKKKAAS